MPTQRSASNLAPEIDLILCCARRNLGLVHSARLRQTLQKPIDWPLLIDLADENGLLPLVCHHLAQFSEIMSADWITKLRETNRQSSLRALFLTGELLKILEKMSRLQIPALPYKGPVLAQMAYGTALLRQFDDLDIVVPQGSMGAVYEDMESAGYQPRFPRTEFLAGKHIPGEYVFTHTLSRSIVEFHTEATLRHFPRPPDLAGMVKRAATIPLNGRQISTFGAADTLLMLCVHGAKDFWSRLIWVADVAAVTTLFTEGEWECVLHVARESDTQRMLMLGLWLAQSLFDPVIPGNVARDIANDRATAKIGAALRDSLIRRKPLSDGLRWRSLYRIRLVPPFLKGFGYWLRLSTAPAEEDWSLAKDSAHRPPYRLLRLLRLWRKYERAAK